MTTGTQQLPKMVLKAPPEGFRHDKTKNGWKLESDCGPVVGEPTLTFEEFLREGELSVPGEVILARAKEMPGAPAGQSHAERMLDQQDRIPVELRGKTLIFETVWVCPSGDRHVVVLSWRGRRWCLYFYWPGRDFGSSCRVVRLGPDTEGDGASK